MSGNLKGTTICAVRRNGQIAIAGDGQVTMGEHTIFKTTARKVRRLYNGEVVVGFAGSVADAFTLCEKFEEKLQQCGGNLEKAAVALAQNWRGDQMMRQLESMMITADKEHLLILSGTGEVIDPDEGIAAIRVRHCAGRRPVHWLLQEHLCRTLTLARLRLPRKR